VGPSLSVIPPDGRCYWSKRAKGFIRAECTGQEGQANVGFWPESPTCSGPALHNFTWGEECQPLGRRDLAIQVTGCPRSPKEIKPVPKAEAKEPKEGAAKLSFYSDSTGCKNSSTLISTTAADGTCFYNAKVDSYLSATCMGHEGKATVAAYDSPACTGEPTAEYTWGDQCTADFVASGISIHVTGCPGSVATKHYKGHGGAIAGSIVGVLLAAAAVAGFVLYRKRQLLAPKDPLASMTTQGSEIA
jgi:hypothetical protein